MSSLFGLAPGGVYPAIGVTADAVRSYRTLSPLPNKLGGLLSVALSLESPPPGVTRHRVSVEPGLSSIYTRKCKQRPSDRLALGVIAYVGALRKGLTGRKVGELGSITMQPGCARLLM